MLSKYLEDLVKNEEGLKLVSRICEDLLDYLDNPKSVSADAIAGLKEENFLNDPAKDSYLLWLCFRELSDPEKTHMNYTDLKWIENWLKQARTFNGKPSRELFILLAQKQAALFGQKQAMVFDRIIDAAQSLYKYAEDPALQGRFSKIMESCRAMDENYKNQKV